MQNFQGTFETRKRTFISAFSFCTIYDFVRENPVYVKTKCFFAI